MADKRHFFVVFLFSCLLLSLPVIRQTRSHDDDRALLGNGTALSPQATAPPPLLECETLTCDIRRTCSTRLLFRALELRRHSNAASAECCLLLEAKQRPARRFCVDHRLRTDANVLLYCDRFVQISVRIDRNCAVRDYLVHFGAQDSVIVRANATRSDAAAASLSRAVRRNRRSGALIYGAYEARFSTKDALLALTVPKRCPYARCGLFVSLTNRGNFGDYDAIADIELLHFSNYRWCDLQVGEQHRRCASCAYSRTVPHATAVAADIDHEWTWLLSTDSREPSHATVANFWQDYIRGDWIDYRQRCKFTLAYARQFWNDRDRPLLATLDDVRPVVLRALRPFRNTRLVFIGDSLTRNMYQSLFGLCQMTYGARRLRQMRPKDTERATFHWNVTPIALELAYYRSNYLVSLPDSGLWPRIHLTHAKQNPILKLSEPVHSALSSNPDVIILNTAHWWYREGHYVSSLPIKVRRRLHARCDVVRIIIRAFVWYIRHLCLHAPPRLLVVVSTSPMHSADANATFAGSKAREFDALLWRAVSSEFKRLDVRTRWLWYDVFPMSILRRDAHPALHTARTDYLHWCLPGVPDSWTLHLFGNIIPQSRLWNVNDTIIK